jgi:hypothetical protein
MYVAGFDPRRSPDGRLVDRDDLVEVLQPVDPRVPPRLQRRRQVQIPRQALVQDLVDQRALARARHARHDDEPPQWKCDINLAQVILRRTPHHQPRHLPIRRNRTRGHRRPRGARRRHPRPLRRSLRHRLVVRAPPADRLATVNREPAIIPRAAQTPKPRAMDRRAGVIRPRRRPKPVSL